jgi:hypothetical protein
MKSNLKEPKLEYPFDIDVFVKRVKLKNKDVVHLKLLVATHAMDTTVDKQKERLALSWLSEFDILNRDSQ